MTLKYVSEFRDGNAAEALAQEIARAAQGLPEIRIMEVCGGHTLSIFKFGIRGMLPSNIRLISGPGCPVCVTANDFIDTAIAMSERPDVIITTFGDLIRVPGSRSTLREAKTRGADIRICYSPLDALEIARRNPEKQVVFLGIGFETTAPVVGATVRRARQEGVGNFSVLSAFKTMPDAMRALLSSGEIRLNAFICPGHVTVITGTKMYEFITHEFGTPCVVAGFEPLDLLQSILQIVKQVKAGRSAVENEYSRAAGTEGNPLALQVIREVFTPCDVPWRGLGVIPGSGLRISDEYEEWDAAKKIPVSIPPPRDNPGCICGEIMRGVKEPMQCPLFKKVCTPESPKGSCMVSDEGTCGTYFRYGEH